MSDDRSHSSKKPQGPAKPWSPEMEAQADDFVAFLKDSKNKVALKDFIFDTYKRFEAERIERVKARIENEQEVDSHGAAAGHAPGNLEPLVHDTLNMSDTEHAFARGLRATQGNMERAAEERVEEINRLLAGIGGFSSQLKSRFARSTVVFLEQEDPKRPFRERLTFSINLPNYELKTSWEEAKAASKGFDGGAEASGRTQLQATWDEAVNALAQIISSTGLKPKYVKNDRNYGRFIMKQDLRTSSNLPDEYFSFTLDYNTAEKIKDMCVPYNRIMAKYQKIIDRLGRKLDRYPTEGVDTHRYAELKRKYVYVQQERDYFVGTTPDPNQLEEGLLFVIEVSTLKDYHIVKDRMQSIMTRYILHLSKIAAQDAAMDPDLEYEMWRQNHAKGQPGAAPPEAESDAGLSKADIDSLPQYVAQSGTLKPVKKAA